MKSIKFIFSVLVVLLFLVACTSDDIAEDETLYGVEDVQSTGDDGGQIVIRERT